MSATSTRPAADWRAVDWPAHEHTMALDGAEVAYADIGAGEPALLLIHGLGGQWRNWLANIPTLAGERRVIAVDLPGFGRSAMPRGQISVRGYADVLDELCERLGLGPVVAVGNSLGGFIAAELALSHPERVARLVLVDAAGIVPSVWERTRALPFLWTNALIGARMAAANRTIASRPGLRRALLRLVAHDPASLDADLVYYGLLDGPRPGTADALAASLSYLSHEWGDRLEEIRCPTLVIWGEGDALIPVRHAREFARRIPDARVLTFPRTGHIPMVEQPKRFNAALLEFSA